MKRLAIGIIPDGNRKWATQNKKSWNEAYVKGAERAVSIVRLALLRQRDVERLVFFGLSKENMKLRPKEQIRGIVAGLEEFFELTVDDHANIAVVGDPCLETAHLQTRPPQSHPLNVDLLINYSGKWDLETRPIRSSSIPPLDLVIRTSGTTKLSGFLPMQSAYADLRFADRLWPDFTPTDFADILNDYLGYQDAENKPSGS